MASRIAKPRRIQLRFYEAGDGFDIVQEVYSAVRMQAPMNKRVELNWMPGDKHFAEPGEWYYAVSDGVSITERYASADVVLSFSDAYDWWPTYDARHCGWCGRTDVDEPIYYDEDLTHAHFHEKCLEEYSRFWRGVADASDRVDGT